MSTPLTPSYIDANKGYWSKPYPTLDTKDDPFTRKEKTRWYRDSPPRSVPQWSVYETGVYSRTDLVVDHWSLLSTPSSHPTTPLANTPSCQRFTCVSQPGYQTRSWSPRESNGPDTGFHLLSVTRFSLPIGSPNPDSHPSRHPPSSSRCPPSP